MNLKKHIPNTLTSLNLICGSLAIIFSFQSMTRHAVVLVLIAALFDFLDGFAARLLKAYSDIGKELDSLADVVSFGLAPALIMYPVFSNILTNNIYYGSSEWIAYLAYIPIVITVGSALRLAKFNIDTRQNQNFLGLPTPANALLVCSIADLINISNSSSIFMLIFDNIYTIPILSILLSYLLISEIPMFSLKIKSLNWEDNHIQLQYMIISVLLFIVTIATNTPISLWVAEIILLYIVVNIINYLRTFSSVTRQ